MIVVTQSCVSFRAFALTLSHYPGNSIIRCMIVVTQSCAVFPYCPLPIASVRDDSQASCLGAISAAGSAVLQLGGSVLSGWCVVHMLLGPPCFSWGDLCCQVGVLFICCWVRRASAGGICVVRLVCCSSLLLGPPCSSWGALCCQVGVLFICCWVRRASAGGLCCQVGVLFISPAGSAVL